MIKRRFLILFLILSLFNRLYSADIGTDGGVSFYNFAEVGVNNKDDLYTIKSILGGISYRDKISFFELKTSLRVQVPFNLTFTDALGVDEYNYLSTLLYFGGNFQIALQYQLIEDEKVDLLIGPVLSYDYFYLRDYVIGKTDVEYIFSSLGIGLCQDLLYKMNSDLSVSFTTSYVYNGLPIGDRVGEFLWSNNLLITLGLIYSFDSNR